MIFPSLCLGVRSLDFGLDAANTASTALAAARRTMEGERERERYHSISGGISESCQQKGYIMIALYKRYLALPVALALCVGKISLFPLSLIPLPPSPIIFSAPPPGTGLIGDTLATGTGWIWKSGEIIKFYYYTVSYYYMAVQ